MQRNYNPTLLFILLGLSLVFIGVNCTGPSCDNAKSCDNAFVTSTTDPGIPTLADVFEGEPNDFFFEASVIAQTPYQLVDGDFGNDFSYIGTINSNSDEDWFALSLNADDFDRITPQDYQSDNIMDCSGPGSDTDECGDYNKVTLTNTDGLPEPNGIPDSAEITFRDSAFTLDLTGSTTCDADNTANCMRYNYQKPRHTIEVTSLDGSAVDVKVEVFAPGLTLDKNGALTKKPIAVTQMEAANDDDYPLEGPVDITENLNQRTVFPSFVEHRVRVMDGSTEGVLEGNYFYHSCYCEGGLGTEATKQYGLVSFPYELLIERNLSQFRDQDPYGVGKYYVRVTSNGRSVGKQYRIRWFWDYTQDDGNGGKVSATHFEQFLDETPCPLSGDPESDLTYMDEPTSACFDCPNASNTHSAYINYEDKLAPTDFVCEYDAQALAAIVNNENISNRDLQSAMVNVFSSDELTGNNNTYWQNNWGMAGFKYQEPAQWDTGTTWEPFCDSNFADGDDIWCAGTDNNTYEPYTSLIRYIPFDPSTHFDNISGNGTDTTDYTCFEGAFCP